MLREAWVALPGATGIFGFQLILTTMPAFEHVPREVQLCHFCALAFVILALVILLTPVALHRLAFRGRDEARSYRLGSKLVVAALAPLATGIAADFYVAAGRMQSYDQAEAGAAVAVLIVLLVMWFALPGSSRMRRRRNPNEQPSA